MGIRREGILMTAEEMEKLELKRLKARESYRRRMDRKNQLHLPQPDVKPLPELKGYAESYPPLESNND